MYKKINIWVVYLVIFLGLVFALGFGILVRQELVGDAKFGKLSKSALYLAESHLRLRKYFDWQAVNAAFKDRFPELTGFSGTPLTKKTYLLLSKYDSDLGQSIIELVDLTNFKTLHTWQPKIDQYNDLVDQVDEFEFITNDFNQRKTKALHPLLTADGGLIFSHSGPLRKIDACSNLIWQNTQDHYHHSVELDSEENIWAASYLFPQHISERIVGRRPIKRNGFYDDAIVKLSSDGVVLYEKSIAQVFIDNKLEYLLFSVGDKVFAKDPLHINDIQPVNHDSAFMRKGDVFLSLRHQSMVLLYRPSTNKIIWKSTGEHFHQHDVDILSGEKISIFNNNSKDAINGVFIDGHNEVLIYDFTTESYASYLNDSLAKNEVKTIFAGRSQILPNGDLFIEETVYGRILYFTADGEVKWVYVNRSDTGKVSIVSWSRILYDDQDLGNVKSFLDEKKTCND